MSYYTYGAMTTAPSPAPLSWSVEEQQRSNMVAAMKQSHETSDADKKGTRYQHSYATSKGEQDQAREPVVRCSHGFLVAALMCMILAFGWLIQQVPPTFHPDKEQTRIPGEVDNMNKDTDGGDDDDYVGSFAQNSTTPLDSGDGTDSQQPSGVFNVSTGEESFCSSIPACASEGLMGLCCPTQDGINLKCCGIPTDEELEEIKQQQLKYEQGN